MSGDPTETTIDQEGNLDHNSKVPALVDRRHEWGPSRVGHGETQCKHCLMTNREAWLLGEFCL